MTPERLQQIQDLYDSALERAPDAQPGFLAKVCGGDEELRHEVESLLAQDAGGVMNRLAIEVAAGLLASGPLDPGSQLGPYQIEHLLGAGAMGAVYQGRDTRLDRIVAIKISRKRFSERFEREARAVAALSHPNICHLYDVGPNYIVLEYVDGSPVAPTNNYRKLLDVAVQIADGMAAAHASGFVHRDLKPANVLVTPEGRVKILDFGLAKAIAKPAGSESDSPGPESPLSEPGMVVGTAAYMSPEQASGLPQPMPARISSPWQ